VVEGKFREDLYYRLSVIRIRVPPLRERREEVPHLASYFLREACERLGKPDVELSSAVLDQFAHYLWPGNVRQLRNEIQRAVALSVAGGAVTVEHLSPEISQLESPDAHSLRPRRAAQAVSLAAAVEQVERDIIGRTLDRTRGNISESARVLGLTRRGLYLKLRRLGLEQQADVDTN
jgi:DNA-binding NtrC family response regulator